MSDPFSTTTHMPGYGTSDPVAGTGSALAGGSDLTANSAAPAEAVGDSVTAVTEVVTERAENVKEKATEAALAGKQAVGDVAETVADKAQDVAQEASRQARDLVGEAKSQVSQQVGDQHQKLVAGLRSISNELAAMARSGEQPGVAAELAGHARARVQSAADWLEGREPGDLLHEVRSFARQRPGSFLLGAAFVGVLAGRMTRGVVAAHSDDANANAPVSTAQLPAVNPGAEGSGSGVSMPASALDTQVIGYSSPPNHPAAGGAAAGYGSYPSTAEGAGSANGGGLTGGMAP